MGYIICPILIPPHEKAEEFLQTSSSPKDGWKELGDILLALRAHDSRIEDKLADLMQIVHPPSPDPAPVKPKVTTIIAIGDENRRVQYHIHRGRQGRAVSDLRKVLSKDTKPTQVFESINETNFKDASRIISGRMLTDGSLELRQHGVERENEAKDGTPGPVNLKKSKAVAKKMVNGERGGKIPQPVIGNGDGEEFDWDKLEKDIDTANRAGLVANLLEQSGLARNPAERDVNIIEDSINEATRCLRMDELTSILDKHFGIDKITSEAQVKQADGCTIAALLLMNAAMLHQRIAAGNWLSGISGMDVIKNTPNVTRKVHREWNKITRHDFLPVLEPAIKVIESIQDTGRESGLNRALHHLAGEAELIAENYADLGADHAGPLFNRVMGNQASDGAYFTRPPAATLLAALTLDVTSQGMDWSQDETWRAHRAVDLACGSGTLIAALLTDMKRRASDNGARKTRLAELQKLAVEDIIAGLDFNPVSLQLAAAQLTAGNRDVAYRKMQLYRMPYGPDETKGVRCGTPELLGQQKILHDSGLGFYGEEIGEEQLQLAEDDPTLSDAVDAVKNVRIVVMNPPFTNRAKMGKKFSKAVQREMRQRVDAYENKLVTADPDMAGFVDKNSIAPLFVALAERCLDPNEGVISMIHPTIALTTTSGRHERILLAKRFHIHTLLTCHRPGEVNLSQNTGINESMIIARRCDGIKPPTRIISLDRFPKNEGEALELHKCLMNYAEGTLPDGWGEVSEWSTNRIEKGDWSAAAFRSPVLAEAAARIGMDANLLAIVDQGIEPSAVLQGGGRALKKTDAETLGSFPVLYSKSAAAQKCINANPDEYLVSMKPLSSQEFVDHQMNAHTENLLHKAGHLLVTAGQNISTGRLTAVASERKYIGVAWMPVPSLSYRQAKAMAVFLNSTAGRIQLMRNPGKNLAFPAYSPGAYFQIRTPDLRDNDAISILSQCWEDTKTMEVPQYRDGECEVRKRWDEAVSVAIGWDAGELAKWRKLLHEEPHVRGLGRNQFA